MFAYLSVSESDPASLHGVVGIDVEAVAAVHVELVEAVLVEVLLLVLAVAVVVALAVLVVLVVGLLLQVVVLVVEVDADETLKNECNLVLVLLLNLIYFLGILIK